MNFLAKSLSRPLLTAATRSLVVPKTSVIAKAATPSLIRCFYSSLPHFSSAGLPDTIVVLEYEYAPQLLHKREPFHESHLFLAKEMIEQGDCIAGGPITPHCDHTYDGGLGLGSGLSGVDQPTGAFFWFTSRAAADEFLSKDPYALADLVTNYKIYDWHVAVSK